jgi:CDP-diacylglycerol--serine O-phosphatidyltransferase
LERRALTSCAAQISFGVAPASCAFALGLRTNLDVLLLSFFVCCGLTRLARFNVTVASLPKDATGKSKYFEGTPIPTSLSIVGWMGYWVYNGWVQHNVPGGMMLAGTLLEFHTVVLVFVAWGCMMTSRTIHIPKP